MGYTTKNYTTDKKSRKYFLQIHNNTNNNVSINTILPTIRFPYKIIKYQRGYAPKRNSITSSHQSIENQIPKARSLTLGIHSRYFKASIAADDCRTILSAKDSFLVQKAELVNNSALP